MSVRKSKKGDGNMKYYKLNTNFDSWLGFQVPDELNTLVSESELGRLAADWGSPIEDLMEDLEELGEAPDDALVVPYQGRYFYLTQDAQMGNCGAPAEAAFFAPVRELGDPDELEYEARWEITGEAEGEDFSGACDWDHPAEVKLI